MKSKVHRLRSVCLITVLLFWSPCRAVAGSASESSTAYVGTIAHRFIAGFEDVTFEGGYVLDSHDRKNAQGYFRVLHGLQWNLHPKWELQLGARARGYYVYGAREGDDTDIRYHESYFRYRAPDRRITLGAQIVRWGRLDFASPTDQFAVQDLTRGPISGRSGEYLAVPAIRWEEYFGYNKLDVLWLTHFVSAQLPGEASPWYPIDRERGRLLGIPHEQELDEYLAVSTVDDRSPEGQAGGAAMRLSRDGPDVDWAVTAQRVRNPQPYFEIDPSLQGLLPDDLEPQDVVDAGDDRETFRAVHPWTTVLGADVCWAQEQGTWRLEAAWLSDMPVTTWDFAYSTTPAVLWAMAWEFFPDSWDARIQLQLNSRHHLRGRNIVERNTKLGFSGDLDCFLDRQRWRIRLQYVIGITDHELYLHPELARLMARHGEWYLGAHIFSGKAGTLGGLYRNNDLIVAGWRRRFR